MLRFAANLSVMFTEVELPARFERAAAAGFRAIEMLFPYDYEPSQIAEWLASAELECVLFNLPAGDFAIGERGLAALPGREDEFRRSIDIALSYAKALGVVRLHAMAGLSEAGANAATYRRNLKFAAKALADEGIDLLIEPINARDTPGYFLNDHDAAIETIRDVVAPNLRLQSDLYHLQIMSGDVSRTLQRDIAQIGHIQIAGVPDRSEPDRGELAYDHVFPLLEELGYDGWIGCEYRPRGRTEEGLGWLPR